MLYSCSNALSAAGLYNQHIPRSLPCLSLPQVPTPTHLCIPSLNPIFGSTPAHFLTIPVWVSPVEKLPTPACNRLTSEIVEGALSDVILVLSVTHSSSVSTFLLISLKAYCSVK